MSVTAEIRNSKDSLWWYRYWSCLPCRFQLVTHTHCSTWPHPTGRYIASIYICRSAKNDHRVSVTNERYSKVLRCLSLSRLMTLFRFWDSRHLCSTSDRIDIRLPFSVLPASILCCHRRIRYGLLYRPPRYHIFRFRSTASSFQPLAAAVEAAHFVKICNSAEKTLLCPFAVVFFIFFTWTTCWFPSFSVS